MSDFQLIIEQTKRDSMIGENLLKSTESFFDNIRELQNKLNNSGTSKKKITQPRRRVVSSIY